MLHLKNVSVYLFENYILYLAVVRIVISIVIGSVVILATNF